MSKFALFISGFVVFLVCACKQQNSPRGAWHHLKTYPLSNVNPISITGDAAHLYVSSGLKTEVHKMNYDGGLVEAIKNIRKPKYINSLEVGVFLVAESEAHVASRVAGQEYITTVPTNEMLQIPYGISVEGNNIVISDYAQHKIYFNRAGKVSNIGTPGIGDGQFNGPTDLQIKNGLIYVADAKNNRIQIFDLEGKFKTTIGEHDNFKMVGGLYVSSEEIVVTDYNGNRVLIYDLNGKLKQTLTEPFSQPSDVFVSGREMYVVNYNANTIEVFNRY